MEDGCIAVSASLYRSTLEVCGSTMKAWRASVPMPTWDGGRGSFLAGCAAAADGALAPDAGGRCAGLVGGFGGWFWGRRGEPGGCGAEASNRAPPSAAATRSAVNGRSRSIKHDTGITIA